MCIIVYQNLTTILLVHLVSPDALGGKEQFKPTRDDDRQLKRHVRSNGVRKQVAFIRMVFRNWLHSFEHDVWIDGRRHGWV